MSVAQVSTPVKEEPPRQANPCPRCGKPITDAAGLGWCPACGYCRSLEEGKASLPEVEKKSAVAAKKPSLGGLVELGEAMGGLPRWVWIMLMGVVVFGAFSLLPNQQLAKNSYERALWSTCQIVAGLLMIFAAQLWAIVLIGHLDEKISFKDVLLPTKLWVLTCKQLPRTHLCVWLGSWGLTLILSALIFIGGLPYWMNYLPGGNRSKNGHSVVKGSKVSWIGRFGTPEADGVGERRRLPASADGRGEGDSLRRRFALRNNDDGRISVSSRQL